MNISKEQKKVILRLAAIACDADGIDSDGRGLPFEHEGLQQVGSDFGLEAAEITAEIENSKKGLEAVSAGEWDSLRTISAEDRTLILEKIAAAASADAQLARSEGEAVSIIRTKLDV